MQLIETCPLIRWLIQAKNALTVNTTEKNNAKITTLKIHHLEMGISHGKQIFV